jgi:hypothetical protein
MTETPKKTTPRTTFIFLIYCGAALAIVYFLPTISNVTGLSARSIAIGVAAVFLAIAVASAISRKKSQM